MLNKEKELTPYNPYDPAQNELLLIQPSWRQPTMTLERASEFVDELDEKLGISREYIRVRQAMSLVEYVTSYNYVCVNPISLSQEIVYERDKTPDPRFNFAASVMSKIITTQNDDLAKEKTPLPHL